MRVLKQILGGLNGYSAGNVISILKAPLLYGGFSCNEHERQQTMIRRIPKLEAKAGRDSWEASRECSGSKAKTYGNY